jgi:sialate O-acetylesterase
MTQYKKDEAALKKAWEEAAAKAKAEGKKEPPAPQPPQDPLSDPRCRPSNQYNGLIASLHPFAIRGAAWYQGENDAGEAAYYRTALPTMIRSWRECWGQGEFPFLIVQLPPCGVINVEPPARAEWAEMRESQQVIANKVPHTGLVSTIDLGDEANPPNLHPPKKQPIGERLALAARALAYGEKIEYSGPVFDQAKFDGPNVTLTFTHVGSGLEARGGSELKGFTVAGEDKKFIYAKAEVRGNTVVVSSPQGNKPVAVRYAWDNYPVCNLISKDGLPALPFRTDEFPVK